MANELSVTYVGANAVYCLIRRMSDNTVWDPAALAWDVWADGDLDDYDIPMTDRGGDLFTADAPSGLTNGIEYRFVYYERAGASPALTDLLLGSEEGAWSGSDLVEPTVSASDGNYAAISEVKAYKIAGTVVALTSYTDAEIGAKIALAEALIETITGDIFYVKTETNLFDGNGLTRLFFPPEVPYRLLSVTRVREYDLDGTTVLDTFVEDEDFKSYPYYLETALELAEDTPRRRFGTGGVWPKGQDNIEIVGTWGRSAVPADIREATILLTLEDLIPGSTGMGPADTQQITWPDFSVTFHGAEFGQQTGFAKIDRILARHLNHSSMFLAVPDRKQTYDNWQVD